MRDQQHQQRVGPAFRAGLDDTLPVGPWLAVIDHDDLITLFGVNRLKEGLRTVRRGEADPRPDLLASEQRRQDYLIGRTGTDEQHVNVGFHN